MNTDLSIAQSNVVSVTQLNRRVRTLLESGLPQLWVAGEISNFKRYDSGHCYFSLKDAGAQVRCVMFRNRAGLLDFQPREGLQVEARVVVTLYEARGDFQLTVEAMRPAGLGALFERFEALKKQLATEGLFDQDNKRALPKFPKAIGIVTSPAAAALRDVLTTLARRTPNTPIILYPTPVQGLDAAPQIAKAIRTASERDEVDVLIVCRGGGSLEDLWSFNEEIVARAIAACNMPVVSGVGHETDFTIADFAADLRAPTPTAAAELVSPNRQELLNLLHHQQQRLVRAFERDLHNKMLQLDQLGRRLQHPGQKLARQAEQLQYLRQRLQHSLQHQLQQRSQKLLRLRMSLSHHKPNFQRSHLQLEQLQQRLQRAMTRQIEVKQQHIKQATLKLEPWNPQAVLARGYALVSRSDGGLVRHATAVRAGETLAVQFADGNITVNVNQGVQQQHELPI
ncbi:exodeoxyribonuclease VII large subunit [Deefgea tanakiae]|uniref:Exodeoxyribonuclease 7 large subunit n=1 Tax=Deefgea tanakiae TaxID=2865840 RepID=A0ABX8Z9N0_9NEIS|nr:exodeoxyribonuclease VII large subunit [Deefgea tanakiae]QZA79269.1 exodeoxyribonuclease VII large subunit [Deefgea tanakiae]